MLFCIYIYKVYPSASGLLHTAVLFIDYLKGCKGRLSIIPYLLLWCFSTIFIGIENWAFSFKGIFYIKFRVARNCVCHFLKSKQATFHLLMLQYPKLYQCPLSTNSSKELDYDWYLTKEFDSKELFRHKSFKLLFFVFKISEQNTT